MGSHHGARRVASCTRVMLASILVPHLLVSARAYTGMYTQHDFDIHALDISGPVKLQDGRDKTLTAHVFVKVRVYV